MDEMVIVVDTREQRPFEFADKRLLLANQPVVKRGTLPTGDYSIEGFEARICIERKSKSDLFGSCGQGRDRLEREFQRMAGYEYAAMVIEADWQEIYKCPPSRSKMSPKIILRTMVAWQMRYQVHVWTCPHRLFAEKITYLILDRYYRDSRKAAHGKD